jgi:hypothetical protein
VYFSQTIASVLIRTQITVLKRGCVALPLDVSCLSPINHYQPFATAINQLYNWRATGGQLVRACGRAKGFLDRPVRASSV